MADVQQGAAPAAVNPQSTYIIRRRNRNWMVLDPQGALVCITLYKRGAMEVVRRLAG